MFADVIVLRNAQNLDRPFTYTVPAHFEKRVFLGARVLVPFGSSGYLEGIIIDLMADNPQDESVKMKEIHYVFEDGIHLSTLDLECAKTIKSQTICALSEAIQLFLPANTMVKQIKTYRLNAADDFSDRSFRKNEQMILEALSNGSITHDLLCPDMKDQAKSTAINRLLAMDAIHLTYSYEQTVKDRLVEWVVVKGDMVSYAQGLPNAHKAKKKLADFLIEHPIVKRLELQNVLKIPKSVIDGFAYEGIIEIVEKDELRVPTFMKSHEDKSGIKLNSEQTKVYSSILSDFERGVSNEFLIHGITGSGKTEVYAELIESVLSKGKKAILLVPEISLTPQIVARFASRFGEERIALIHSKISPGERMDQWRGIRKGDYDIIIGARSAVFAPSDEIGLIIIDECHETAFKSEKRPKYNTYEVAKMRMGQLNGFVVAGSATPSVADYFDALEGKRRLYKLEKRHNTQELPEIQVVDMRQELISGNRSMLSQALYEGILERLERKEQTIIFLNRKGHSTFVSCRSCGFTLTCPNCDVTLTYFKGEKSVRCNYCNYQTYVPKKCPKCQSTYFKFFGVGTEKVEEHLREQFKNARIARMDRTTTSKKGSIEQIISSVEAEEVDILVGTQMVAKGFDFKKVTLIGILSADLLLNLPHYQASERAYQLFTQVAGRAGRGDVSGSVILQTYTPDHYALNQFSYDAFYQNEIQYREALKYPPFYHMINLIFSATHHEDAETYAKKSHAYVMDKLLKKGLQNDIELYPANPALLKKIDNAYRWQVVLKVKPEKMEIIKQILEKLEGHFESVKQCKISIDLDANTIL